MKFRLLPALLTLSICLPLAWAQSPAPSQPAASPTEDASTVPPPPQLYGMIDGDVYTSPTGLFKIRIPVLPELGGNVTDTPSVVTFDDLFNSHISIGAFPLTPELKWEYEKRGTKEFLIYFFTKLVMPDFVKRFAGASMEDSGIYLPQFQGGSMLIFTLLPNGSFFARDTDVIPPKEPLVAKRGNLCFVHNGSVYYVSTELAERVLEHLISHQTPAQEDAILRERLIKIVDRMELLDAPPGGVQP